MNIENKLLEKALSLLPEIKKSRVDIKDRTNINKPLSAGDIVRFDFGRHMTGHLHLHLGYEGSHPDAPVKLALRFAEVEKEFDEDEKKYSGWICSSWIQQEQINVDVVPGEVLLPRRYAFRYVQIEILAISSKFRVAVDDIYAEALTSANEERLETFTSKESSLVQMDRIACNTLRDCMQQVFEDGPKRDRRLWLGDLRLQALANYETYKMNDMVKGCLYLFAALPRKNGQLGACIFLEPQPEVDDSLLFDYSLLFIAALLDYYRATSDLEALEELWPTARRQISIAEESVDDRGLVKDSDEIGWCFLDWSLELNKQAGAQGVLLYAIKNAIELAKILKLSDEVDELEKRYKTYKEAAINYLWDADKELFISGEDRQISYASQIFLILGEAVDEDEAKAILQKIKTYKDAVSMVTPYIYHHYVQALLNIGCKEEALGVLKSYWGKMADLGADTYWELFNPDNPDESPYGGTIVNSYCHAWSCAPAYFLRKYYLE